MTSAVPFISVQDIIDHIGRGGTADAGMVQAADAACDIVRGIAERTFNFVQGEVVFVDGTGTDCIPLPDGPVSAAGTVLVNGGTITDYVLDTRNGMLMRGTAGVDPRPTWPLGRQNIRVTYDHGYTDVNLPRDVRMVALELASRIVVQGPAKSETVGDVSITYGTNSTDLTTGERLILSKYRQIR